MMSMFENLKQRFNWNWVRIDQLAMYVVLKVISPSEYEDICGEKYEEK